MFQGAPLSSSVNLRRTPDNVWQKEILQGGWQNKEWTRGKGKGKKRKGRIVPSIFEVEASFQRNEIRTQKYVYIYMNRKGHGLQLRVYMRPSTLLFVGYVFKKDKDIPNVRIYIYIYIYIYYIYMSDRIPDKVSDRMPELCQKTCQIMCQIDCQTKWRNICHIAPKIYVQKHCQVECRNIWHMSIYTHLPDRMPDEIMC